MDDYTSAMFIGKFLFAILLGSIWALSLSSCGFTAGPVTVGTTGYLAEANRGKENAVRAKFGAYDSYTASERAALDREISK